VSVKAMTWAWAQPTSNAGQKLVLLALADHAGEDFTCYPSSAKLSEKTGLGAGTVRRYIDALEADGKVEKVERRRRPDGTLGTWVYRLVQRAPATTGEADDQRAPGTTGNRLPVVTGERTSAHRCASPARTGARAEPSVEPSMNRAPTRDQLTRDRLAELAGEEHAQMALRAGQRVHTPAGLARAKARELLRGTAIDDLLALDEAWRACGHEAIPQSVLVGAALGATHSLAHYRLPDAIDEDGAA